MPPWSSVDILSSHKHKRTASKQTPFGTSGPCLQVAILVPRTLTISLGVRRSGAESTGFKFKAIQCGLRYSVCLFCILSTQMCALFTQLRSAHCPQNSMQLAISVVFTAHPLARVVVPLYGIGTLGIFRGLSDGGDRMKGDTRWRRLLRASHPTGPTPSQRLLAFVTIFPAIPLSAQRRLSPAHASPAISTPPRSSGVIPTLRSSSRYGLVVLHR